MQKQTSNAYRNTEAICRVVLSGTYAIVTAIAVLLGVSIIVGHTYVFARLAVCAAAFGYLTVVHFLVQRKYFYPAAYMLIALYMLLATGILWAWGINTPMGTLLFSLVIMLAGILLTARHALFAATAASGVVFAVQIAHTLRPLQHNTPSAHQASFGDAIAYTIVFSMMALISWLYNREVERSLHKAYTAEAALRQQKADLEIAVKKRTAQLQRAQLEEMRHMYRFAEIGQLGVNILHDLANHLTALNLEIDSLQGKQESGDIARINQIMGYLGDVVHITRDRLHGGAKQQQFDLIGSINKAVEFLQYKAGKEAAHIEWQAPRGSWQYVGDPALLGQAVTILTSNAIDAYHSQRRTSPTGSGRVAVILERNKQNIIIKVCDWGKGIPKSQRHDLFKPFHGTKETGLGIGLFLARQTIETHFSGTLELNPDATNTEFIIKLPLQNAA